MTIFAFVRNESIKTRKRLRDLESHALRLDKESKANLRVGAVPGAGLDWPNREARHLTVALTALLKRHKAEFRKNAPLLHTVIVGVSPEWIMDEGDLHDPDNPRNQKLLDAAVHWVKSFAGEDSIVSARMDLDEFGGGVVDVAFAPIIAQHYKGRSTAKPVVSTNKCLETLALSLGYSRGSHYAALNTSWAKYAAQNLDKIIQRGKPKVFTGKEHLPVRLFKAEQEAIKREAAAAKAEENAALAQKMATEAGEVMLGELTELLKNPDLATLAPRPKVGTWKLPRRITEALGKLKPVQAGMLTLLETLANIFADVRTQLDSLRRKEAELDEVLKQVTAVKDRMTAEDDAIVSRAARALVSAEDDGPSPY